MDLPGEMNKSDFGLFQKLIYDETGINMTDKKCTLLANRIRKRLVALNIDSYNKYYLYLKNSPDKQAEIINMVDAVTTNVTEFFRNPKQFDVFRDSVMPAVLKAAADKRTLRILSAGCSSGEEPYTIAILLLESFAPTVATWTVVIDAMDISTEILRQAEEGVFKKDKMKGLTDSQIEKFFDVISEDTYRAKAKTKSLIKYRKFNLKSDNFTAKYDVVFCRNVVIYFDRETKSGIYQKFYDSMQPHGYFLVGYSEGIINDDRFKYHTPGIYTKNPNPKSLAGDFK